MLPHSRIDQRLIKWHLTGAIDYSRQTLRECVLACKSPIKLRKPFPPIVLHAALGLHVRLCRKYRQAIALAELGQGDGSDSLTRSMFEAFLAQAFICRQTVKLRRRNGGAVNLFGKKLTQEFRAYLYLAHDAIQNDKRMNEMAKEPGLKLSAKAERRDAQGYIDMVTTPIGADWARALKANTCAGLSIEDFAHSFNTQRWYHTIYKIQSSHVHPGEPDRFITYVADQPIPQVKWQDGPFEINRTLWVATFTMGLAMTEFNRLLDKNHQPYVRAGLFRDALPEMKRVFRMQ
jgi:hypothetical protein